MTDEKILTLSNYFDYRGLSKYEGLHGNIPCRAPTTYVGVEVELEQVRWKQQIVPSSLKTHADGSLKLNGQEIVTIPIQFGYLENELLRLVAALETPLISSRCSVHVHLNVRDFTVEELHKFLLIYLIFEKAMFHFSGNRNKSNFCVPLHSYPPTVSKFLRTTKGTTINDELRWYKYSALNLCPIWGGETRQVLGTAEFRHMEGTLNVERIINWINLIVSIKLAAKQTDKEHLYFLIRTMNTTSDYYWLAKNVFRDYAELLVNVPSFKEDIESCILSTKTMLFQDEVGNPKISAIKIPMRTTRKVGV